MLELGFDEVYHLQGGILNYLEQIPTAAPLTGALDETVPAPEETIDFHAEQPNPPMALPMGEEAGETTVDSPTGDDEDDLSAFFDSLQ